MTKVQDVVLTLTNDGNFYEAFTCVLRTAYENKYEFNPKHVGDSVMRKTQDTFRRDMVQEIKRYYGKLPFEGKSDNNELIAELVSHYSEECFGFHVPVDQALGFMKDGWKLSTHKADVKLKRYDVIYTCPHEYAKGNHYIIRQDYQTDGIKCYEVVHIDGKTKDWAVNFKGCQDVLHPDNLISTDYTLDTWPYWAEQVKPNEPKQENTMNPENIIKTKVYVSGNDASDLTDDQLFAQVATVEKEIERLDAIKTKPKKLEVRIAEMKSQLDELIKYIDSRD